SGNEDVLHLHEHTADAARVGQAGSDEIGLRLGAGDRAESKCSGAEPRGGGRGGGGGEGGGNLTVQGLPLIKPPYGRITALDMNKGTLAWQIPHGETPDNIKNHAALKGLTIPRT